MTQLLPSYVAGERDTLTRALDRAVKADGNAIFFEIESERISFLEFDRRTTRFANALIARWRGNFRALDPCTYKAENAESDLLVSRRPRSEGRWGR